MIGIIILCIFTFLLFGPLPAGVLFLLGVVGYLTSEVVEWVMDKGENKTCPHCSEKVKRKAVVCKYCGYEFKQ